ncbi:MAG: hypothetical protein DWQ02_26460 [Bacteroidetes bacterium]|nr:MAG: hypothetical protein DWQ02_26460 [Bacteroidota bacterium]
MKIVFYAILLVHGLIHLMGFAKAFSLASLEELSHSISKPFGIIWLITTILFLVTFIMLITNGNGWWIAGLAAIILSQIIIISTWSDAKWGTLANIIILIPVVMGYFQNRSDSFKNRFESIVQEQLATQHQPELLSKADMEHLPPVVQKYLEYTNVIGKPKVHNFSATLTGEMKLGQDKPWLNIISRQYNFYKKRSRTFYIESKMFGIPFDGLHSYLEDEAVMEIKVGSIFSVADARGDLMTKSETVTLFNDMCIFAPATLIDPTIDWKEVDALTAEATFSNAGHEIKALLFFNEKGQLVDFSSNDRYESADGKAYKNYQWTTPVKDYRGLNGQNIPAYGEAIWHYPDGPFVYAKFNIEAVDYNVTEYRGISD